MRATSTGPRATAFCRLANHTGFEHLIDRLMQPVGIGQHDVVELTALASLTSRDCSVSRYRRIDAIGVFSSCVTALMKLSCSSLRLISRTRKTV